MHFTTEYFTQRKVRRSKRERLLKVMYPAPVHQPVKPEIRDRTRIELGLGADTSDDHRSGIFRHPLSPPDHHVRPHSPPCRPTKRRALYEHGFYSRLLSTHQERKYIYPLFLSIDSNFSLKCRACPAHCAPLITFTTDDVSDVDYDDMPGLEDLSDDEDDELPPRPIRAKL
ncbi:hypothetical protein C8R47DRAFT_1111255 [Mycena vitilis]|nr:hypothetical protein C8R47DRAFT_1111255 [Mycena vitilis]